MLDPKVDAYRVLFSSPETGHQVGGHTPEAPLKSPGAAAVGGNVVPEGVIGQSGVGGR